MKIVKNNDKLIVPGIPVEPEDFIEVDKMLRIPMLTYLKDKAVGLAHSQINFGDGPNLRAFAMRFYKTNVVRVFINPVVTLIDPDDTIDHYEECLSLGHLSYPTKRVKRVTIDSDTSPTKTGGIRTNNGFISLTGWDAIVAQHEIDHLDGILLKSVCYCGKDCIETMGQTSCTHDPRWHA